MTSNYIASRFRELRNQIFPTLPPISTRAPLEPGATSTPQNGAEAATAPHNREPLAAGQVVTGGRLLIEATELQAQARDSLQPTLVLVRNSQVGNLMQTVGQDHDIRPLWSEWQDSVWKISGPKFKNRK